MRRTRTRRWTAVLLSASLVAHPVGFALADETSDASDADPSALKDSMISLTLPEGGYIYTGSPKTPEVTVRNGAAKLIEDVDYTVAYDDNVEAGTATVTITAPLGSSWTGQAQATFSIAPAPLNDATITILTDPYPYVEGEPIDPGISVVLDDVPLVKNEHYTVSYDVFGSVGTATVVGMGNYGGTAQASFTAPAGRKVSFVDGLTNEVISEQLIAHGTPAAAPSAPEHEGYRFRGWDKSFSRVTSDLKVTAEYERIDYLKVTFVDGLDGTIFAQREAKEGEDVLAPAAPVHEGYQFYGWSNGFTPARADVRTTALYLPSDGMGLTRISTVEGDTAKGYLLGGPDGVTLVVLLRDGGEAAQGWVFVGGSWRYGSERGVALTGRQELDGATYYFDSEGRMRIGWIVDDDTRERVFASMTTGVVVTHGWFFDGYGWYYAESATKVAEGWRYLEGDWYWFNPHGDYLYGRMATGWVWDGSAWYWMEANGTMSRNRWLWKDGSWYLLGPSGAMRTGWVWNGDAWYYLGPSGAMLHDAWSPDGCYLMPDGRWNGA